MNPSPRLRLVVCHARAETPTLERLALVRPALKSVEEYDGLLHSSVILRGTREALLATGLARADWFPGDPGQPKTRKRLVHEGHAIDIRRDSPRLFTLIWGRTEEERARRELERARREAFARLRAEISNLPGSPEDLRDEIRHRLSILAQEFLLRILPSQGGYRLSRESHAAIAQALQGVSQAITDADVAFDPKARRGQIAAIYDRHGARIPQDDEFERFLRAAVSPGEGAGQAPAN